MYKNKDIGNHIVDHLSNKKGRQDNQLSEWVRLSKENENSLSEYKQIWKAVNEIFIAKSFNNDEAWKLVDSKVQRNNVRALRLKNMMYASIGMAASLILVLALAFYTGMFSVSENRIAFSTQNGSRSQVMLPDGSQLKLNSGTELSYQFNKITKTREVIFTGEAFFEIAKNKTPFILKTKEGMRLEVLGTKFSLSAYPEDRFVKTALVEGKIELGNELGDELLMEAGQTAQFNNQTKKLQYIHIDQDQMLGWLENKIILDETPLFKLKQKLERRYDVNIILSPKELGEEIRYTGVFEEETIQDVLNALVEISSIEFMMKGREIVITKKQAYE